jgi:hypothetical protein
MSDVAAVPAPLACDGQVTHDPATKSLLVKVSGVGGIYWRRGHAKLAAAEQAGSYWDYLSAPPTVLADGVRGEPVSGGWLRFRVSDSDYRELAGPGLGATVVVDQAAGQIMSVSFGVANELFA